MEKHIEVRGRNGWLRYHTSDVVVSTAQDEVFIDLYSRKIAHTAPVMITGTRKDVESLLQGLLDKVKTETKEGMQRVTVLTIGHKHGTNTYACRNEEVAEHEIFKYVEENWDLAEWHDRPEGFEGYWDHRGKDISIPEDRDKAIEMYFQYHEENEGYSYEAMDVIG
jgi:hypothetical protein